MKGWSGYLNLKNPGVILTFLFLFYSCGHLPDKNELLNYKNANASLVYSEEKEIIGKFFQEDRTNISWGQLPDHLINALVATEDSRFFEHRGFDTRSLLRVLVKTFLMHDRGSGGGSTITQQLAKNMFGRDNGGLMPVLRNKTREAILAHRIEKTFSKEDILTLYLNTVSFGENVYGIEAASVRFFNKSAEKLRIEESALLVGMLKANTYYNPRLHPDRALARRNVVLRQMVKYNYLKSHEADSLSILPLALNYKRSGIEGSTGYFLVQVKTELDKILEDINIKTGKKWDPQKDGLIIETTLNLSLQNYVQQSFFDHLPKMQNRLYEQYNNPAGKRVLDQIIQRELIRLNLKDRANEKRVQEVFDWNHPYTDSITVADSVKKALMLLHAGLIAIDPESGEIKAWEGGIDFKTQQYDQVLARRQLASVFKPVIYAAALEEGMEPCYYLDNDSLTLADFQDWSPENYDHSYGGKYSLAGALAQSMNIPTYSLFLKIGFEKVDSMWKKMGFSFDLDNTPSLAMGTAEASIKEVAVAYSSFANGGYLIRPRCIKSVRTSEGEQIYFNDFIRRDSTRILNERTSLLMSAMLRKAVMEGTGLPLKTVYGIDIPLAGKTGTSQNYADAWFAVYNPKLVLVSRVGASTGAIHFNSGSFGSGSALALPLVALTLRKVIQNPKLNEKFIAEFPGLPQDLKNSLDCPDFREKNLFDVFIDIFEPDKSTYGKNNRVIESKIRSLLRKIFRNKKH